MRSLTSIVAMNHEGAIGAGNTLPWRLKNDLKFFRAQTFGNVVVMGRRTYDSLGRRPLPGRCNVVLSHRYGLFQESENCIAAFGIEEGLFRASKAAAGKRECFIVGGASMYEQFAPYVDRYLITLVDKHVPDADTFLNESISWPASDWDLRLLAMQRADGIDDEADFAVFEVVARHPEPFLASRNEVIERLTKAARQVGSARRQSRSTKPRTESSRPALML